MNTTPAAPNQARRIENFTRVETFGDNAFTGASSVFDNNNVLWLKVLVDPDSREVFAFQPQIVPGNRVVVPVPLMLQGALQERPRHDTFNLAGAAGVCVED